MSIGPRPKRSLDTKWGRYSYSLWTSKIFNKGLNKKRSIFPNINTKKDVKSWNRYLYLGDILTESSKKLIKINGVHNKDNGILTCQLLKKPNVKS